MRYELALAIAGTMTIAAPASAAVGVEIYGSANGTSTTFACMSGACTQQSAESVVRFISFRVIVPDSVFTTPETYVSTPSNMTDMFSATIVNMGMGRLSARNLSATFDNAAGITDFTGTRIVTNVLASSALANQIAVTAVPEPATWTLMLAGFGLAGYVIRRRRYGVMSSL